MIRIEEKPAQALSGITSIFVSFQYKPEIVNIIKSFDHRVYDKKTFVWELPVTSLARLLDELTYFDDITLQLYQEKFDQKEYDLVLADKYKVPAYKHQIEAIKKGLNCSQWLLLDQPGAGKSSVIIHIAEELKVQKGLQHCLIICGINSLKPNWKKEIKKHSNLSFRNIGEKVSKKGTISYASVSARAKELKEPLDAFFYIINIESLRNPDIIEAIRKSKNQIDMIVVDEIHVCTNPSSQQAKGLLKLKDYKYKIGLTGTLLTNSPLSAYVGLKWIGVEKSTFTNFKSQYCEFGGYGGYQIMGYKNINILKDEIETCSLRRTKEMLNVPPKNIINEYVEMNPLHTKFYENVREGIKEECDKIELNAQNTLALTTRLRQAAVCPSILTSESIPASKLIRCCELAEEIISQGEKVVIMSRFKEPLNQLRTMLKQYNPVLGSGDVDIETMSRNIELFQKEDKYKIFLGSHSRAGTGITLNAAKYLIMLDLPWGYYQYEQIVDRIHRVTNTAPVFVYNLICTGTIDELVFSIVSKKQAMSEYIVDNNMSKELLEILRQYIQDL